MLTVGGNFNAGKIAVALMREIRPEAVIGREVTVQSEEVALRSLGVAHHFLSTLKTSEDLQLFPSPIPDLDIKSLISDICEVIRESASLTKSEFTNRLEEGERCLAQRYLKLGLSSPGCKSSSAKTSPESAVDTTHIGTYSDLTSLVEPPSPVISPVAASTGPVSGWTFLPPGNRVPEGEQEGSRWTMEDSDSRSELVYIEFSRVSSRGLASLAVEEGEPCTLVTPRFRMQPERQKQMSRSSMVSVPLDSPEKEETEVENTMGRVFLEPLRQRVPDSLSRAKFCAVEESRPQPCTCALL